MGRTIANVMAGLFIVGAIFIVIIDGIHNDKESVVIAAVLFVGGINLFFTAKDPD